VSRPSVGLEPPLPLLDKDLRPWRRVVKIAASVYRFKRVEHLECGHRHSVNRSAPSARSRRCDCCAPVTTQ
jgi:hypothetical protein